MSVAKSLNISETIQGEVIFPPGDLYSHEPPLETDLHLRQMILFLNCLEWWWRDREDFFASGNLTIYYSPRQRRSEDFRGPDFFVVLETERKSRKSWVVWEEGGKYPNLIIEILSQTTAKTDRELKKQIYQDIFRTPDYFWFDPNSLEFAGFNLISGEYVPLQPTAQGWLWSQQLKLYLGIYERQLRFFTPEGELVPTPEEVAIQEAQQRELAQQQVESERQQRELAQQQAESERQQKELAQQQAEQLIAQLRTLGIDPDLNIK